MAHGIAILLLAIGCGKKVVHHPGEEFLDAIVFEGNTSIKSSDLRAGLALRRVQKRGASPDPYLVVVDGQRILGEYLRRGFLEADVRSRVERHGDRTTVIYTIHEGPRAKTRVMITGLPPDDPDLFKKVRNTLPLEDGEYFLYAPYDEAKEKMLGVVEDAGFAHAQLNAHVIADRANHLAIVHLQYDIGPKCKFGTIDISGVGGELADAVRERVAFDSGEQYSSSAIAQTQRNLYEMRRFSTVRVLPDKSDGDVINVRISLAHATRNEIELGGGLGMDPATYEVRARTGYSKLGWPFPLTDLTIDLRPAYAMLRDGSGYEPRIRALTSLRRMDLFRPFVTGTAEVGYNYVTVEAYTNYGPVVRLGAETPLFAMNELRLRAGWELDYNNFRHISPLIDPALEVALGLDHPERVGMYTQTLSLDLRDNPLEPRLGAFAEVRIDEGTKWAGGAFEYVRVTPEVRGFVPVPTMPVVLAARVRAGRFYGEVPATQRYFSGGATTQRGFAERHLAPTVVGIVDGDMEDVPVGGAELFESNFEIRSRLTKVRGIPIGLVAFLDGGDCTEVGMLDLGNLNWAIGPGLRAFTKVGAIRLDVGYRLNRTGPGNPEPDSHYAFHLSIGEAY
ncbi:MAG TPA: BamA/TamA family outer membrane protein [Kofleriaceae bacterium]|nr:BamA/TamA family outer membrane protein [Kofleriaceae bacterium]